MYLNTVTNSYFTFPLLTSSDQVIDLPFTWFKVFALGSLLMNSGKTSYKKVK